MRREEEVGGDSPVPEGAGTPFGLATRDRDVHLPFTQVLAVLGPWGV